MIETTWIRQYEHVKAELNFLFGDLEYRKSEIDGNISEVEENLQPEYNDFLEKAKELRLTMRNLADKIDAKIEEL